MYARRQVVGDGPLGDARLRIGSLGRLEFPDPGSVEEREGSQVPADVAIVRVEPVLVERERAGLRRIEPDARTRGRLAELGPALVGEQRVANGEREILPIAGAELLADQLQAGGDVAPLVGPAHLQLHAAASVQMQEIGGLQQHVAELGEAQARSQANLDRILGQHVWHGQVLADVAQEAQQRVRAQPFVVVDDFGAVRTVEVEEPRKLGLDADHVLLDRRATQQQPLRGPFRRIADHGRPAAHDDDRGATRSLQVQQAEDRHEVSDME